MTAGPQRGLLSEEQIRTTYFVVPPALIELLVRPFMGDWLADYVLEQRKLSETTGGATDLIGWPDGTTIVWTRPDAKKPIDVDKLVTGYYKARHTDELMIALGRP